ncbi:MAG: MlaD family protein [Gemmatimonadota bacterium]
MSIRDAGRRPDMSSRTAANGNGRGGEFDRMLDGGRPQRPSVRQGLSRLMVAAIIAVLLLTVILTQRLLAPASYLVRIPTADASGIFAGSDVTIAGVNAGTVRSVSLAPNGDAVITAALDPSFAPMHTSATAQLRPKSLLGEMYVSLDPGTRGPTLPSGATLSRLQVNRSTDLQQVFNMFDQPTRSKLQTLVDELGGGVAGRGDQLNQAIPAGSHDIADLSKITSTLNARSAELQSVLGTLNTVTTELARSDRRKQLGVLIQSTQQLMANLRGQQAQLQRAVVTADAALGNLHQGLQGTAPALGTIAATLPATVSAGNRLLAPLATGANTLMPQLNNLIKGIQAGPSVFGGRDASGYATRISLVLGCGSISVCSQLTGPLSSIPGLGSVPGVGTGLPNPNLGLPGSSPSSSSSGGSGKGGSGGGILGFLLGGKQ